LGAGTPIASFNWSPLIPDLSELVTFDASASMPFGGEIVSYYWNFGDGSYAYGKIVTHQYSSAGNYTVTLNITDSEGLWDIEQEQISVKAHPIHDIAITNITFSKQNPNANETIYISVTLENRGTLTETFDVNVNYTHLFDPLIGAQTIILTPGEMVTLNFTWTPTDSGRYEIKAYTSEIPKIIH
jgi:PKD repeat protein